MYGDIADHPYKCTEMRETEPTTLPTGCLARNNFTIRSVQKRYHDTVELHTTPVRCKSIHLSHTVCHIHKLKPYHDTAELHTTPVRCKSIHLSHTVCHIHKLKPRSTFPTRCILYSTTPTKPSIPLSIKVNQLNSLCQCLVPLYMSNYKKVLQ